MAILRKQKREHYTVIDNSILEDKELSLKAKGLLCLMLSLPDYWDFTIIGLTRKSRDGKAAVMAALAELEEAGYFRRVQVKENGRYAGYEYTVSEYKMTDFPYSDFENTEMEHTETRTQVITNKAITNKTNTNKYIFTPPSVKNVQEYIDEKGYSIDAEHFVDYYTSNGWMVGKSRMKDWKAAVRNWERNNENNTGAGNRVRSRISETNGRSDRGTQVTRHKPLPLAADVFAPERSEDDA